MPTQTTLDPVIQPLTHFAGSRDHAEPTARLQAVIRASHALRAELLDQAPVPFFRSIDLIRVPYPTRYALRDACSLPSPFVHILNRMFIVQFPSATGLKTLLVSASDVEANRATPFFRRLAESFGPVQKPVQGLIAPVLHTVEQALAKVGIAPEQVDYLTYDHLHTQDLRRWLGNGEHPGYFPNAKLLVMRQEWASAQALLPPQRDWYCPDGIHGIPAERVVLLDSDVQLGQGVALVRTPGHTEGNHSIVVRSAKGLVVTSENGVAADAYAPRASRIPGLQRYARETGMEVVLNGNTMEGGLDQYLSMIAEREIAGPCPDHPEFYHVVPSSELTPSWLSPGIKPSVTFGEICEGTPQRPAEARHRG